MKKKLIVLGFAAAGIFYACKPNEATPHKAENALDAGREFIKASLEGNEHRALFYVLKDSTNENLLVRWKESYRNLPRDDRDAFKKASIVINSVDNVSDSVAVINFSNSYKNKPQVLKVVKVNDEWVVDFKYTFSGNL